jgi:hypothetical protein
MVAVQRFISAIVNTNCIVQATDLLARSQVRTHDVRLDAKSVISFPPDGPNDLRQAFN